LRQLDEHKVNPANDRLTVTVADQPGVGGASHRYEIAGFDTASNPSADDPAGYKSSFTKQVILFQNGPIAEVGVNGVTHEALLAIVADRLRSFQKGAYSSKANACALTHIEEALHWLHSRTIERMRRGIEGTHAV